jgi:peptidoglycan hydrolase-like protein with peptidoglycan-binding domain
MLSGRMKLQLAAFALLSGGVAGNLFLLQPQMRRGEGERQMAGAEAIVVGDTGSIGRPYEPSPVDPAATIKIPEGAADVTRAVQRELQVRGYETGGVDGVEGVMTRAAIMGFEYDHGMALTGHASQELLKRILLGPGERATKPIGSEGQSAQARDLIRSVQTSLARLGYEAGRADGRLSPETMRAIREFEVDQTLPESGRISGPLVARLARLVNDGRVASQQ